MNVLTMFVMAPVFVCTTITPHHAMMVSIVMELIRAVVGVVQFIMEIPVVMMGCSVMGRRAVMKWGISV
jgi:hypothetical protein